MFWEFGIVSSEIEDILDNDNENTIIKLLNEPDILQEINSRNTRLIDYCSKEENIEKIFNYVITKPDESLDNSIRYKYPMLCCEILTAGITAFDDVIIEKSDYFKRLIDTFKNDPIDILICNYSVKLFIYFVSEYSDKIVNFLIKDEINIVDIFIKHIEYASVCDAILKLQSHELSPDIRVKFIDLLYEQNIIGKLYSLITYDTSNEKKSSACHLFIEMIRIYRLKPTLFLDNYKYTENMTLVNLAQCDNLLKTLFDNMFAYLNMNIDDITSQLWSIIDKTIYFGSMMLLAIFDTTRISDIYGDELNELGYIRNNMLIAVSTDFVLLSHYIEKFVNYLHYTINHKIEYNNSKVANQILSITTSHSNLKPLGITNLNIIRLLCVLTVFQCEVIEKALIQSNFFSLLWSYLPYFSHNSAFHSLLFDTTSFILLSDIYKNAPRYLEQTMIPSDTTLYCLMYRYELNSKSKLYINNTTNIYDTPFIFGQSILLYRYMIDDVQILLILLQLYEKYCNTTFRCNFRGHLLQFLARISKLSPSIFIPENADLTKISSIANDPSVNSNKILLKSDKLDILTQKFEYCNKTSLNQFIKNNEVDPNVITSNTVHDENLDSLFRSFDAFIPNSNNDHNDTLSIDSNNDSVPLQSNVKLDVNQGIAYMESVKQSLTFGPDSVKFPNRGENGSRNAFIYSSDEDDNDCYDCEDKLPSFDMEIKSRGDAELILDKNESDASNNDQTVHNGQILNNHSSNLQNDRQKNSIVDGTTKVSSKDQEQLLSNPYENTFVFGGKNSKYIDSVLNDQISLRLERKSNGTDSSESILNTNLSCNSIIYEPSPSPVSSLSNINDLEKYEDKNDTCDISTSVEYIATYKSTTTLATNTLDSITNNSGSEIFYSFSSTSENNVNSYDCNQKFTENTFFTPRSSFTDDTSKSTSKFDNNQCLKINESDTFNELHFLHNTDRKGTSSPIKLSLSYNSDDNDSVVLSSKSSTSSLSNKSDAIDEVTDGIDRNDSSN